MPLKIILKALIISSIGIMLCGCAASKKSVSTAPKNKTTKRYKLEQDIGPHHAETIPNLTKIPNAVPRNEPKSRIGNPKTYTVFNKKYSVLPSSKGYKARGTASWYGKKFHGYHTSNGEVYDMYSMSAAHKTLPLPTYLKVTNLDNGKSVIVKVNDRGPFHEDRIVDLSYAAASKLGILATGTGNVEISAINPSDTIPKIFLQVGTFTVERNAKNLADRIAKITKNTGHDISIKRKKTKQGKAFHVHIGPLQDEVVIEELTKSLAKNKLPKPVKVKY